MIIEYNLTVDPQTLKLSIPQATFSREVPNIVVINPETRRVYGIGDTKAEVKERLGERWQDAKDQLKFLQSFADVEADPEIDKYVIYRFMMDAHKQVRQSSGFRYLLHRLQDRFDFNLNIPNFDEFPTQRQKSLVNFMQADLRAQFVIINQKHREIPLKLRRFETFGRLFFTLLLPYLIIAGGIMAVLSLPGRNLIVTMGLVLLIGLALEVLGKTTWMLVMRRFLPVDYLRYFLPRLPLPAVTNRLAGVFLKE